ncbi:hypothetical protein Back11_10980 [Paenibacillus baekrokdamisoli]|uniref:Uncharacterized protein n=1 Tax=Paenibacillus baekrokdamisoli TaxID=1712516 RepID=A0A3G9J4U0_9BACL|nr:hypothetical protein [Paenibacillus baekrokdamisoli]MBB3067057.1 hypothetical protein [Paenibacillus baekrokdamisoli]BBH19753.1 hypothetical protein Back11_10980 [Paenibacillus baekrokdamisoli]
MLLELQANPDKLALDFLHFPTRMQAVIWRNWGLVPVDSVAEVLGATEAEIREAARELGLEGSPVKNEDKWLERGYITIIRANWHLLSFEQLLQLLGWTEERLAFTLKEDDFLWIKLGSMKPWTEPVQYKPLSSEERVRTQRLRATLAERFDMKAETSTQLERLEQPFEFLDQYKVETKRNRAPARKAAPDELRLDVPWTIACSQGNLAVETSIKRFVTKHEQAWGIKWNIQQSAHPSTAIIEGPVMRIVIIPDGNRLAESHTISADALRNEIIISAVDGAGIMRGLQWIAAQMNKSGVPYIIAGEYRRTTKFDTRIIYSYSALYGDPLLESELNSFPVDLLERLSDTGINGIWLQSVLYSLVPWAAAPELSVDWERRLNGLRQLVDRAARYGIGVYLYCNEPRSMPVSFFADKPDWQGHTEDGQGMLCTSHPDVQKLLFSSILHLFQEVPGLAGLITITMSENWTHCYSRAPGGRTNCPRCSQRSAGEVVAEVNRLIVEGATLAKPDARILCWTWGWSGWTENDITSTIGALPDKAIVMCTSEEAIKTNIAGIPGQLIDYSMSVVGPGEKSLHSWRTANARGLRTAAKVQFNNTWECSAVPFLPVFQHLEEHLNRLDASGVSALMLSWTLGGYPSLNLELAAEYYWDTDTGSPTNATTGLSELLRGKFGSAAGQSIAEATAAFSRAFREFPFDLNVLYTAPQNYGPANLLHMKPTGFDATMIGFPYDDLQGWRGIYPESVFANQFKKLSRGWKKGLQLLEKSRNFVLPEAEREFGNLIAVASAAYLHFHSTYLQIEFVRTRNRYLATKREDTRLKSCRKLINIVREEADHVQHLYDLVIRDSRIGFEASNHYYYTVQDLKEKLLNCSFILEQLQQEESKEVNVQVYN